MRKVDYGGAEVYKCDCSWFRFALYEQDSSKALNSTTQHAMSRKGFRERSVSILGSNSSLLLSAYSAMCGIKWEPKFKKTHKFSGSRCMLMHTYSRQAGMERSLKTEYLNTMFLLTDQCLIHCV